MRNTMLLFSALLATTACYQGDDTTPPTSEEVLDLKVEDCKTLSAAFSQTGCPKPTDMTDAQQKTKCEAVKKVALNDYKKQFGKDPNCSEGWVFGPDKPTPLLTNCIKDSGKNLCKLSATNPPDGTEGWPTTENYSECLNDWVVFCTDKFPATMGVADGGAVCFHNDLLFDKLPVKTPTGREVCQRLKDGKLPGKCDAELCKPKMKPETKKNKNAACTATYNSFATTTTPAPEPCVEAWSCEACDPETDADCEYDVSCGCTQCDADDNDPACSTDLACPAAPVAEPTTPTTAFDLAL